MGTNIFAFVIVLGVLIFFHELGHFLVARLFGVGVEKFSLGFGPRIFGKKIGITDYRVSAIPLGGYVKMVGEEPDAEIAPERISLSFTHKSVWKKILIVAAGPFFNVLLAVLIFYGIFIVSGNIVLKPVIGEVQENSPAMTAGLQAGDVIQRINGQPVESWDAMAGLISESQGESLQVEVRREGESRQMNIQPELRKTTNIFGEEVPRYVIGITAAGEVYTQELGLFQSLIESVVQTYKIIELTVVSVIKIIEGTVSTKTIGGPIMIAELAGQQAKQGALNLLFFIALISVNLAILNLLPIPVLDGGHLLFFFIELIIGRPVSIRVREVAQQAGMFVLILLMIFVFYNDLTRIFFDQ
ncbi:MAG TPA: RIP metalloprotease RseP [Desulfobacterales bacterium]